MPPPQLQSSRKFLTQLFDALSVRTGGENKSGDAVVHNERGNPLEGVGGDVKKQLLALHVAFPNELLPALDLLDRSLVTRFRIRREGNDSPEGAAPQGMHGDVAAPGSNNMGHLGEGSRPHPPPSDGLGRTDSSDAEMLDPSRSDIPDEKVNASPQDAKKEATDAVYYVRSAQQRSSRYSTSFDSLTSYEVRLGAWNCSCPAFAFSAFPPLHPEPPVPVYEPDSDGEAERGGWSFGGSSLGDGIPPVCKHLLACVLAERCPGLLGGCVEERVVSVEEAAGWAAGWGD